MVTVQLASQTALIANFFLILNGAGSAFRVGLAWMICRFQPFQLPSGGSNGASTTVTVHAPTLACALKAESGWVGLPAVVGFPPLSAVQNALLPSIGLVAESLIVNADVFG